MKLGRACQITIGTNNVKESYEFYRTLGFRKIAEDTSPYPWMKVTDDSITLLLYQNGDSYVGLTYFDTEMDAIVRNLSNKGIRFVQRGSRENIFITPTDTVVVLVKANHEAMQNSKSRMLVDLTEDQYTDPAQYPNSRLGIFGEFAHPVIDVEEAVNFWQQFDFVLQQEASSPYPWALMHDGYMALGFHETDDFSAPTITYFAPDVQHRVEELHQAGIYGMREYMGHGGDENNIVIHTPENQEIFLFQS